MRLAFEIMERVVLRLAMSAAGPLGILMNFLGTLRVIFMNFRIARRVMNTVPNGTPAFAEREWPAGGVQRVSFAQLMARLQLEQLCAAIRQHSRLFLQPRCNKLPSSVTN
jgi:hypothetical protein